MVNSRSYTVSLGKKNIKVKKTTRFIADTCLNGHIFKLDYIWNNNILSKHPFSFDTEWTNT